MMKSTLKIIAKIVRRNAIVGAGSASVRGSYEAPVPETLKKDK